MARKIYEELLHVPGVGNGCIAQVIAEFSASIESTCISCNKFKIIIDENPLNWMNSSKLCTHDHQLIQAAVTSRTADNKMYFIINMHKCNDNKYPILCIGCVMSKRSYGLPNREAVCTQDGCNNGSYDTRCDNCNANFCDIHLTGVGHAIAVGSRLTAPKSDTAYDTYCDDCVIQNGYTPAF